MKKLLSVILALVMILSLSTVAFAETTNYKPTDEINFTTINKTYDSENRVLVTETLSFVSTANPDNPDTTKNLTVADLDVTTLSDNKLSVTIPSLDKAGTYRWTITETAGTAAGVTYSTNAIHVIALVVYDNENDKLVVANVDSYIEKIDGVKTDKFENEFKSGDFSVAKEVTGNLANKNDTFKIKVTLTAPAGKTINTPISVAGEPVPASAWTNGVYEKELEISQNSGKITFDDIPVGVTVKIEETDAGSYTLKGITDNGEMTVENENHVDFVVTNEYGTTVDTGIVLDSMPYVLLLAVAAMGLAVLLTKKRASRED